MIPEKSKIIEALIAKLEAELSALIQAAKAAHEAATHEESRAEDAHDTRGLEASYLAGAQANRAAEIQAQITQLKFLDQRPLKEIGIGSLVELSAGGRKLLYLLVPQGGGVSTTLEGVSVQVITPRSPLGDLLIGRRAGEEIELETPQGLREYQVLSIR